MRYLGFKRFCLKKTQTYSPGLVAWRVNWGITKFFERAQQQRKFSSYKEYCRKKIWNSKFW